MSEREFVEAARSLGACNCRIMFVDILPNVLAPVIIYASLLIPVVILVEADLSFLGLGLPPPTAGLGRDDQRGPGRTTQVAWWYLVFPSLALLVTTLAFNLLGDGIRDAFDPRSSASWRSEGTDMLRFLIRRLAPALLVLWLITVAGLRAVLRRAQQRRAQHWRDGKPRPTTIKLINAPARPGPTVVEAVPRASSGTPCTATSATTTTTSCPVTTIIG